MPTDGQSMKKETPATALVSRLEEYWLAAGWQKWFAELHEKHGKLLALVKTLHALDEEYLQAVKIARESGNPPQSRADVRFVRVNFGGRVLNLYRDHLLGQHVKANFFSALFDLRWHDVLPKDKEGNIYLDLNYEWVKPLLDEMNTKAHLAKCGKTSSVPVQRSPNTSSISLLCSPNALEILWGMVLPFVPTSPDRRAKKIKEPSQLSTSLLQYAESPVVSGEITIPTADISELSREDAWNSFTDCLRNTHKDIDYQFEKYNDFLKFKLTEARYFENLVQCSSWASFLRTDSDQSTAFKPMHLVHNFRDFVIEDTNLVELIRESYLNIAIYASPTAQALKTNNIVTFNVDGESVSVLRSSILCAVPGSQLAIRVSEDWVEQESTMDDEGRLIVDFPLGIFLPLIDYIRAVGVFGAGMVFKTLFVKCASFVNPAKRMLEYFAIANMNVLVAKKK